MDIYESPRRGRPVIKTAEELKKRISRYAALYYRANCDRLRELALKRYHSSKNGQRRRGRPSKIDITDEELDEFLKNHPAH